MRGLCSAPAAPSFRIRGAWLAAAWLLVAWAGPTRSAMAAPPALAGSGVATVPHDAAFLTSTLRLKEQLDRFLKSNAYARLRSIPALARALDSWEEQKDMPGSPVSMALTFLELPENAQAVELLSDMVSTDTFLYGEPSCIAFVKLVLALQAASQAAEDLDGDELEMEELEMEDDVEVSVRRPRIIPVARQVELELPPLALPGEQAAAMLEAAAANLDLIVVPDLVWGFKTKKKDIGAFQLKRLEVLAKLLTDINPDLAGSIARRKVAGGEVLAFTLTGRQLPWRELADGLEDELGESEELDKVLARLRKLDIVVALGMIGDWVILSVGDSLDHLDKLVLPGGKGKALIDTPPFAKLAAQADKPLTGISYISAQLAEALAGTPDDAWVKAAAEMADAGDLPDVKAWLAKVVAEYGKRLPKPAAWLAFSFLTEQGYEGHVWNWAGNLPLDGSQPLGILKHAGGSPLAVAASRVAADPTFLPLVSELVREGWGLVAEHGRPRMDDDDQEKFDLVSAELAPLGAELVEILRTKLGPAVADGQVGFVLDAQATTSRLQAELPKSAEPLPLLEPAIVLPLADRKLFVEGLNDFFAWGDRMVAAVRKIDPDAVPPGYRIPEPAREKVAGGSIWSFAIPDTRLDEQVRPAIGVADTAAVFALVPGHAARLLEPARLETGGKLSAFAEPLAAAAALDFNKLIDALEPWIVYATRLGSVVTREGSVDAATELSADDLAPEAREALDAAKRVLEVARCLKEAVAETRLEDDAVVTRWRNVIRDLPQP